MDVRMFTVGPIAENCFLFRKEGSDRALIVDPGDEAERILGAVDELGVTIDGILLTHTHFDHIGAVAPVAKATGAPVWCPEIEMPVLEDINSFVPWPEFGPFESYEADHTVSGGEKLELAGMEIDVIFTPGHSPGHVTYSVPDEAAIFSGDVLFQGSVGRTDLPGGDWAPCSSRSARWSTPIRPRPPCTRDTWASPPWAPNAPPTPSSPSSRASRSPAKARSAMAPKFKAPRGTFDVLPEQQPVRHRIADDRPSDARGGWLRPDRHADLRGHGSVRPRRR